VGNLVYVRCDEQIPADLVLLATSNEDGICYIETSQLDGYSAPTCPSTSLPAWAIFILLWRIGANFLFRY
jgi:hypothetical protein